MCPAGLVLCECRFALDVRHADQLILGHEHDVRDLGEVLRKGSSPTAAGRRTMPLGHEHHAGRRDVEGLGDSRLLRIELDAVGNVAAAVDDDSLQSAVAPDRGPRQQDGIADDRSFGHQASGRDDRSVHAAGNEAAGAQRAALDGGGRFSGL